MGKGEGAGARLEETKEEGEETGIWSRRRRRKGRRSLDEEEEAEEDLGGVKKGCRKEKREVNI